MPGKSVLVGVDVAIMTGNPGRGDDNITMKIIDNQGQILTSNTLLVSDGFDGWLHFDIPGRSIPLEVDKSYTSQLQDTGKVTFGWKYAGDTYPRGHRVYFGTPQDGDFFFKTYAPVKDDLLGTWSSGVWYRNSANEQWVKMATPASQITAGDLDDDGTDDLVGIWPAQGGAWVKYSSSGNWAQLSSTASWIGCGDMNGDGWDDLLGTWTGQGVYYKDSATDSWIKMATPATQIAAGDIDGDGTADLVGIWPGQGGVWVKYSSDSTWERLSSTADWITCGKMRGTGGSGATALSAPMGGIAKGPSVLGEYIDLSSKGPGRWNFVYQEEGNLIPQEVESVRMKRVPGPGELGFIYIEQKNLFPIEGAKKEKRDRREDIK